MGEFVKLTASDGVELSAYVARPEGAPKGALVIVQEIFGVNAHIRSVADRFAAEGYVAVAPAMFDRFEPGVELNYDEAGWKKAMSFLPKLNPAVSLLDVAAAYHFLQQEEHTGIGVVGFCFGGLMSWIAATRGETEKMQPACCVGYYAGGIGNVAKEEPACPVMLHFGADDTHIGAEQIQAVREAHPEVQIYVYEGAGHAFNRDADPKSYAPEAAKLAMQRTLEFFRTHIA